MSPSTLNSSCGERCSKCMCTPVDDYDDWNESLKCVFSCLFLSPGLAGELALLGCWWVAVRVRVRVRVWVSAVGLRLGLGLESGSQL